MCCAVVSVEFGIAVGFSDACGAAPRRTMLATLLRVLRGADTQFHNERLDELWYTNTSEHYLANCSTPNAAAAPLHELLAEAKGTLTTLQRLPKPLAHCAPPNLPAEISALRAVADDVLAPVGGPSACGGDGPLATLYEASVHGLCDDIAIGFVELFFYEVCVAPAVWRCRPRLMTRCDVIWHVILCIL